MGFAAIRATARVLLCLFIGLPLWVTACEADCLGRSPHAAAALTAAADPQRRPPLETTGKPHHPPAPHHHRTEADAPADAGGGTSDGFAAGRHTLQSEVPDCGRVLTMAPPSRLPDRQAPVPVAAAASAAAAGLPRSCAVAPAAAVLLRSSAASAGHLVLRI